MPRTTQWLNSNSYRTYPFIENTNNIGSGGFTLPESAVIDLASVVYEAPVTTISLITVEVTENGGVKLITFTFKYGTTLVIAPVPETASFPFVVETGDSSTHTTTITFGVGIKEIADAMAVGLYFMLDSPEIEPALITVQDKHQVRSVSAYGGSNVELTGDVYYEEGYNCSISILPGTNEIRISAIKNAGSGIPCDAIDPDVVLCSDVLLRVNGLQAGSEGGFRVFGGNGVEIVPDPDNNQIILRSRGDLAEVTCEA